jgi:hypothetical protein
MEVKIAFSPEDYKTIAAELYALMVAQAVPAGFVKKPDAPAPAAPQAPSPVVYQSAPVVIPQAAPAPVPAPVASVPALTGAVTYHGDSAGNRVDDRVAPGTPGTVTLQTTGNTLSVPQPGNEGFAAYAGRIREQAAPAGMTVPYNFGDIIYRGDGLFAAFGGYKADGSNWPIAADAYYNPDKYRDPAEAARIKAQQDAYNASIGWDGVPGHPNDPWVSGVPSSARPPSMPGRQHRVTEPTSGDVPISS